MNIIGKHYLIISKHFIISVVTSIILYNQLYNISSLLCDLSVKYTASSKHL